MRYLDWEKKGRMGGFAFFLYKLEGYSFEILRGIGRVYYDHCFLVEHEPEIKIQVIRGNERGEEPTYHFSKFESMNQRKRILGMKRKDEKNNVLVLYLICFFFFGYLNWRYDYPSVFLLK